VEAKVKETSDEALDAQSLASKAKGIVEMTGKKGSSGGGGSSSSSSSSSSGAPSYAMKGYWEERFPGQVDGMTTYEWYHGYKDLWQLIREATRSDTKVRNRSSSSSSSDR